VRDDIHAASKLREYTSNVKNGRFRLVSLSLLRYADVLNTIENCAQIPSMKIEQIAEEALALPSEERALLADRLVKSLDPAKDGYIRHLWAAEARRRLDEVRSGSVKTISGDEALARVRRARQ
jgi:putative addiction module component (TIGR02574 family)